MGVAGLDKNCPYIYALGFKVGRLPLPPPKGRVSDFWGAVALANQGLFWVQTKCKYISRKFQNRAMWRTMSSYILKHSAKLSGGIVPCVLLGGWRRRNGGGGREGEEDEEEEEEDKGSGRGKGKSLNAPSTANY